MTNGLKNLCESENWNKCINNSQIFNFRLKSQFRDIILSYSFGREIQIKVLKKEEHKKSWNKWEFSENIIFS